MLRHNHALHFPRIGDDHLALDQLREHKLMDPRRGRMDPLELVCLPKLLGLDGPSNQHIGIRDFLGNAIVIRKVYPLHLRKSFSQTVQQPGRSLPELKRMIVDDENLHDWELTTRKSWPVMSLGCS